MKEKTARSFRRRRDAVPEPFILVIFGASGDLTKRKLIPAVYSLFRQGLQPEKFSVVGFARRPQTDAGFAEAMRQGIESLAHEKPADEPKDLWARFAARLFYHRGEFHEPKDYQSLRERLEGIAKKDGVPRQLYLLPRHAAGLLRPHRGTPSRGGPGALERTGFALVAADHREAVRPRPGERARAEPLPAELLRREPGLPHRPLPRQGGGAEHPGLPLRQQHLRADLEPEVRGPRPDHDERGIGVEGRGGVLRQMGALRDMVQNHMMNLLCFVAMESPMDVCLARGPRREGEGAAIAARDPERLRGERRGPRAVRRRDAADGKPVPGYREEPGVAPDSLTETFVAFKANVDNWRWAGVPFYLRTGKRLPRRLTQISIHFKPVPQILFNADPDKPLPPNLLTLRIQPDEGIFLRFQQKVPGMTMDIQPFEMKFGYGAAFGKPPPEAYERLLLDAAFGDSTLFIRNDELEAAWEYVDPIIEGCSGARGGQLPAYPAGTWGPKEAEDLIRADGREWAAADAGPLQPSGGGPEGARRIRNSFHAGIGNA